MLTEVEAKSRAFEDLAAFYTAFGVPTTATVLRYAHIDIEELWSQFASSFINVSVGEVRVNDKHLIELLKSGMLKRLLRILFDFWSLAEKFDYPLPRGTSISKSHAVRPSSRYAMCSQG